LTAAQKLKRIDAATSRLDSAIAARNTDRSDSASGRSGTWLPNGDPQTHYPTEVILEKGSSITPLEVEWIWSYWLAAGKVHLLGGAPGQGKTTLALALMATLTCGGRWPDGSKSSTGNVVMWSGEDDPADTLIPRLMAMGANRDRVYIVKGSKRGDEAVPFDPARDMAALAEAVRKVGDVRLIVVDPIVSAVPGDSHKNAEVRRGLQPLVDLAAEMRAAVLGITHLSKGTAGRDPTERITGSIAFTAVVRVVLLAAKIRGDDGSDKRILVRSKSNIGPDEGGFEYSIDQIEAAPGIVASRVLWGAAVDGTARQLLAEAEAEAGVEAESATSAKTVAADFLRQLLTAPTPSETVKAEAKSAGLSFATVRRASDELGVHKRKGTGSLGSAWYWSLPEVAQGAQPLNGEQVEHLRPNLSNLGASSGADEGAGLPDEEVL
jgi:putative DNA primase/helicase